MSLFFSRSEGGNLVFFCPTHGQSSSAERKGAASDGYRSLGVVGGRGGYKKSCAARLLFVCDPILLLGVYSVVDVFGACVCVCAGGAPG